STLADVRSAGGLGQIPGVSATDPVVTALEAHAALSVLPTNAAVNAHLVEAGYESVLDVAARPRVEFVESLAGKVDAAAAVALHEAAGETNRFIGNVAAALLVGSANGAAASASQA